MADHVLEINDVAKRFGATLALGPTHLSCYGLVYEKGTSLWKQRRAGEVRAVDEEAERTIIQRTVEATGGNKKEAAQVLGISRSALYAKLKRLDIEL